jgi:hypothetical protein
MSYKMPSPGELNQRVTFKRWDDSPNAAFGLTPVETEARTVWAKLESVGAMVFRDSAQTGEGLTHRAVFWRVEGLHPSAFTQQHVAEHDGFRYRVLRALDVNGERQMTLVELRLLGAAT